MANHKSAEKRHKQSEKRRIRNRHVMSTVRTFVKRVRVAIEANDAAAAKEALPAAIRILDRAASKGVIHRNQASRKIGRLSSQVAALS